MDFIKEDGSIIRITNDRLEGILSDGTVLFSLRNYEPLPKFEDLKMGEYEFKALPAGIVAIRRVSKEEE